MALRITRRQLMTRTAAGGVALWVAPTVRSSPAHAAGSVGPVVPPPNPNLVLNASFQDGGPGSTAPNWAFT